MAWIIDSAILVAFFLMVYCTGLLTMSISNAIGSILLVLFDQILPCFSIVGGFLYGDFGKFMSIPLANLAYHVLFEASVLQATPGKRAMGLYMETMKGKRLSHVRATFRHFAKTLTMFILIFLWCIATGTAWVD